MHAGGQSAGVAVVGEKGGAVPVLVLIGRDQLSGTNCQGPNVRDQLSGSNCQGADTTQMRFRPERALR